MANVYDSGGPGGEASPLIRELDELRAAAEVGNVLIAQLAERLSMVRWAPPKKADDQPSKLEPPVAPVIQHLRTTRTTLSLNNGLLNELLESLVC